MNILISHGRTCPSTPTLHLRSGAGLEGVARQVNLADSSKRIREGPFTRTRSGASAKI